MVASTNSNGIGRTLMQMDTPSLQNQYHSTRRFLNTLQSYTNNDLPTVKGNFECQQCGKQFGNQHILKLHNRIHASQSLLQGVPGAAATLTQTNGSLHFNFNMTIDFSSDNQDSTALREQLTNILKSDSLWENVSQSIANIKSQSGSEKRNGKGSEIGREQSTTNTINEISAVTKSATEFQMEQNISENIQAEVSSHAEEVSEESNVPHQSPSPIRSQPISRGKKAVGLTKIRMEDCRRCDECSCIYMDERDYLKHMKNFHKHDIKNLHLGEKEDLNFRPFRHKQDSKRQRQSSLSPQKKCRSCCKQCKCKGNHDTLQPMLPILRPVLGRHPVRTSTAADGELPTDIKDRWNKVVTQRLESTTTEANESDLSHLLSQVEVKIKTEPADINLSSSVADVTEYLPGVKQEVEDTDMFEY